MASLPAISVVGTLCALAVVCGVKQLINPAIVFFLAGFTVAFAHASYRQTQEIPDDFLGTEVTVTGVVPELPERRTGKLRFLLRVESFDLPGTDHGRPGRRSLIRLSWYGAKAPAIVTGDRLRLLVKLRRPNGFLNPGGFDYEKYLYQKGIVATGYVRNKPPYPVDLFLQRDQSSGFAEVRNWLRDRLVMAGQSLPNLGLVMALAVGDRSGIESSQWDVFVDTGTNHLLAISGLHITLIGGFCGLLARFLWRRCRFLQRISRNDCSLYVAVVGAFCYSAMAGFSVPTQRALLMFSVLAIFLLLKRHQRRSAGLAYALIAVCLVNPFSVMAPGFWMSFTAVVILYLVFAFAPRVQWRYRVLYAIRGHLLITCGLYPLTVLFFQQASLVSPLANFIVVPVVGMLVTPAVFVCSLMAMISVPAAGVMLAPVDLVLSLVSRLLEAMAQWPFAVVRPLALSHITIALLVVAAALVLLPVPARLRWLIMVLVLPLMLPALPHPAAGGYRLTFLDVGQGTSVLVQTHRHTLLYDAGPQYSRSFNAADAVIIPYLGSQGVTRLDMLLISHNDSDHSGGADELVAAIPVEKFLVSSTLIGDSLPPQHYCRAGMDWVWDEVHFSVIYPGNSDKGSENDLSCVLQITTREGRSTLLPGDIERYGEQQLLAAEVSSVEVLMAPHHGSATSSSEALVSALQPNFVIHTAGFGNRFGFPRPEVTARYERVGSQQYQTGESGAITMDVTDGEAIKVLEYRKRKAAFWRRPAADVFQPAATLGLRAGNSSQ